MAFVSPTLARGIQLNEMDGKGVGKHISGLSGREYSPKASWQDGNPPPQKGTVLCLFFVLSDSFIR